MRLPLFFALLNTFKTDQENPMKLVLLESPFAHPTAEGRLKHLTYARAAMRDCLIRGEAPFASHLLYTQEGVLEDRIPYERELGIEAGLAWGCHAELTVVYVDLGVSKGMEIGIAHAERLGRPVERRHLFPWGPKVCVCGERYDLARWDTLPLQGVQSTPADPHYGPAESIEMRGCSCGSTLAIDKNVLDVLRMKP